MPHATAPRETQRVTHDARLTSNCESAKRRNLPIQGTASRQILGSGVVGGVFLARPGRFRTH